MKIKVLIVLTILGLAFFSCKNSTKEDGEPIIPTDTKATMEYNENRLDTIPENRELTRVFKGSGGEPFWSVTLDADKIHFESAVESLKSFSASIATPEITGKTTTFTSNPDKGTIKVMLIEEKCIGDMNGKEMTHQVKVSIKLNNGSDFQNFKGCGSYVQN
ncbi:MAG: hypothetical protein COA40_07010 [Aequorivita sp.]|nr:MAG: hypothetical protein COA40_07010 [Aequorivita sp.]